LLSKLIVIIIVALTLLACFADATLVRLPMWIISQLTSRFLLVVVWLLHVVVLKVFDVVVVFHDLYAIFLLIWIGTHKISKMLLYRLSDFFVMRWYFYGEIVDFFIWGLEVLSDWRSSAAWRLRRFETFLWASLWLLCSKLILVAVFGQMLWRSWFIGFFFRIVLLLWLRFFLPWARRWCRERILLLCWVEHDAFLLASMVTLGLANGVGFSCRWLSYTGFILARSYAWLLFWKPLWRLLLRFAVNWGLLVLLLGFAVLVALFVRIGVSALIGLSLFV